MYKLSNRGWLKHFDFTVVDIISLEIAFLLSYLLRFRNVYLFSDSIYSAIALLLPVLHIFIVFFSEEYSGVLRRGYLKELKEVLKHNSLILALLFIIMFATKISEEYSRIVLFTMWGFGTIFVWTGRILLKKILLHFIYQEKNLSYLLVVTVKDIATQTIEKLQKTKYSSYRTSGLVIIDNDEEITKVNKVPVVAEQHNLMAYVLANPVDGVFINLPNTSNEEIEELTERLIDMGITVHISLNQISDDIPSKVVEEINGFTVLTSSIKMATPRQMFVKRTIDLVGGVLGLLATIVATIVVGPIIYKQSPGPIFFSQERVGRGGRRFHIYKFRSMYMDAEERKN